MTTIPSMRSSNTNWLNFRRRYCSSLGLPDHQLIFCTRKLSRIKRGTHRHIKFRSFKHYSADIFKETLTSINFPNYLNFNNATEAYDDFIQKIMVAIDKVAPIKERKIIHNSQ